jgi:hypothetical protein
MLASIFKTLQVGMIAAFVVAGGACGSNDPSAPTPDAGATGNSRFVGTWHPTSGTTTYNCSGNIATDTVTDNLTWATGVGADLVQTSGSCVFKANVVSSTASGLPSQTCTLTSGTTVAVVTFAAYTFSLSADGLTAMESASGNATLSDSGISLTCTYNQTASYTKISQ